MNTNNLNILMTGCSGFLGSVLAQRLKQQKNVNIHGMTEVKDFKSPLMTVHHTDIRDKDEVFRVVEAAKPDITFHLAAVSNVGFSWKNQKLTYEINFIGSSNLLEALHHFVPGRRVLLMSSAELYGGSGEPLLDENVPVSARNPYALSKWAMEMAGDLFTQGMDMDIIKLRSFNFTGPGQDRKFVASDFSYQVARIEKGEQEPVIHVGNLSAIRDISDVRDIARYLSVIAAEGKSGEIYNLCSGQAFAIGGLLDTLLSLSPTQIKVEVDKNKFRPVDVARLAGDNRKIKECFGLEPEYELRRTLSDLLTDWRGKV